MNVENRNVSPNLIDNIEALKTAINEISVYDLNTYTAIELYYRIANKLNEVINELLRYEIVVSEQVIEQNECLQYLLNEGLRDEVINKINSMVDDGTMNTIINHNVFNSINEQIKDMSVSINYFPRLSNETNDFNRFVRAKESLKEGDILLLHNEEYDLGGNSLIWNKNINIKGTKKPFYEIDSKILSNGTILKNGKIILRGHGYTIENVGLLSRNIDNGFEVNTGRTYNIKLKNCVSITKSHCYLFESYEGLVNDIIVEDCESYEATHGFISKATNIKFLNCFSHDIKTFCFGAISDNIPSYDKKGNGSGTQFINCTASNGEFGFAMYSRDMFSDNNTNNILLQNVKVINCNSLECVKGIILGDRQEPPVGVTYNNIYNIIIDNFVEKNSNPSQARGVELSRIIGLQLSGSFDSELNKNGYKIENCEIDVINCNYINDLTITDNSEFPRLNLPHKKINVITFNNTSKTIVKGFLGGIFDTNKILLVKVDDDYTTIQTENNLSLPYPIKGKGSFAYMKYDGNKFVSLMTYSVIKAEKNYKQINLNNSPSVLTRNDGNKIEYVYSSNTSNDITLSREFNEYNLIIRPTTSGTFSFGGFNSNSKVVSNGLITNIEFGKALCLKLEWIQSINKYLITNSFLTNIF